MRALKNLFTLVVILAVLTGGALGAFRVARQRPGTLEEIKPGLLAMSSAGAYLYAARAGNHVVLFDSGPDPAGHGLDAALSGLHASRADVSDLFLTHAHGDHTAAAAGLGGARIHLGAADAPVAEGKAPPDNLFIRVVSKAMAVPTFTVTDPLNGIATIDLGGGKTVKAIPAPGHTPGSYVFVYDGVLFSGDTIVVKEGRLDRGPGFLNSDSEQEKTSIAALKSQLGDQEITAVCAGHGGCTPVGLAHTLLEDLFSRGNG
ncbi:MAG TPA: MBL fold metallo-hydrolase [Polyangia bacterium]|nr:MBL fold metallo-hydrolase [Polyangia bacterium]